MNTQQLIAKMTWFANEALCPVNHDCVYGFVSGATTGWGWARTEVGKWARAFKASIPCPHMCLFMDGDKLCAVYDDFVNLQESPAGFGEGPHEAIQNLLAARKAGQPS